ncbi:MAG: RDD family protein [Rhizobacter sp.]|nr:RDD family protein [Rhizobacter sp.]
MTGVAPEAQAPSLRRRMASFVYEGLLLFGIGLIPGAVGALFVALTGQQHPLQSGTALRVITFVIYGVYFTWFWSKRGQTLPMQTWHIRVVTTDGQRLSQSQALLRFIASCLWVAPATLLAMLNDWSKWQALGAVGVGVVVYALLALLHPQRQFWHDAICGTRLVTALPEPRRTA